MRWAHVPEKNESTDKFSYSPMPGAGGGLGDAEWLTNLSQLPLSHFTQLPPGVEEAGGGGRIRRQK